MTPDPFPYIVSIPDIQVQHPLRGIGQQASLQSPEIAGLTTTNVE